MRKGGPKYEARWKIWATPTSGHIVAVAEYTMSAQLTPLIPHCGVNYRGKSHYQQLCSTEVKDRVDSATQAV